MFLANLTPRNKMGYVPNALSGAKYPKMTTAFFWKKFHLYFLKRCNCRLPKVLKMFIMAIFRGNIEGYKMYTCTLMLNLLSKGK